MILSISQVAIIYLLGLSLAIKNLKRDKTEEKRVRREYKKIKNERLKRELGL